MLARKGTEVHAVDPRASVYDAVAKMHECRVGALLVMDGPKMVGIISERDYARKIILLGRASKETRVEEIMTPDVISISPRSTLAECMQIATQRSSRHLPVLDNGQVVGLVSLGDLVRELLEQQADTIQSLNSFIGSDYPT